jgi:DNA repair photolyase
MVGRRRYVRQALAHTGLGLRDVVIRRTRAVEKLAKALGQHYKGRRWRGEVVYASPLVDVAATKELAAETVEMCKAVLERTDLKIRLLSKSPLLESNVARVLDNDPKLRKRARRRVIFGLSTGTLDPAVSRAIEPNAPSVKRRLECLRSLQQNGWKTFGMLCPILPQDPEAYAQTARELIDFVKCEYVWAEVLNFRADAIKLTTAALVRAGLEDWAANLSEVFGRGKRETWEQYARNMFWALVGVVPPRRQCPRLRFLQYTRKPTQFWWRRQKRFGAVVL